MSKQLTAVSIFSGCGGFDLGAVDAGVSIVWANDIDPAAGAAYRTVLPGVPFHEGDIRTFKNIPRADILIGCYPCTGFSEAAKRRAAGSAKVRDLKQNEGNYLYREFLRVLRQVQPKFLFVENVRGMLSASGGWFLMRQIAGFKAHGFRTQYKMLIARDYGVAQERRRVFIVGVHKSVTNFEYEFPEATHGPERHHPWLTLREVLRGLGRVRSDEYLRRPFHGHYLTRPRKKKWSEQSYTIVAHAGHTPLHPSGLLMHRVGPDRYELRGKVNRRLSWRECAAIQGLPSTIEVPGGLFAKHRVVGNAVPPKVASALIKPIVSYAGLL
jgi:DNA (cytosine-5)-methyltransferase 1